MSNTGIELYEQLVEYLERAINSREAVERARVVVVDTLAVAAAAYHLDSRARRLVDSLATGEGRHLVVGAWRETSLLEAVSLNALLAHSLEYDDWLPSGYVHAGSIAVPPALAGAERVDALYHSMLVGVVAGYEVSRFFGALLGRKHYTRWHTTATVGAAGAAAAYTLSSGGSIEDTVAAIVLSLNYTGGLWAAARGGDAKPFSPMNAVDIGVRSSLAARTYRVDITRILREFCSTYSCRLGEAQFRDIALFNSMIKLFPTCYHSHSSIVAASRLSKKIEDKIVARVTIRTYREAARVAGIQNPSSLEEAKFSIPFLVSVALVYGVVNIDTIERGLSDNRVLRLLEKVRIIVDEEMDRLYPDKMPSEVEVYVVGGETLVERVDEPPGARLSTISIEKVLEKITSLSQKTRDLGIELLKSMVYESPTSRLRILLDNIYMRL